MADLKLLEVERRLERVERLLRAAADEARSARVDLGGDHDGDGRWAKMMLAVLEQLQAEGGVVSRQRFLEIGEEHGYNHRGMAGFYQQLVERGPNFTTRLTTDGQKRLETLRDRYAAP